MVNRCSSVLMYKISVCLNVLVNWGLSELIGCISVIFKIDLNLFERTVCNTKKMKHCYICK